MPRPAGASVGRVFRGGTRGAYFGIKNYKKCIREKSSIQEKTPWQPAASLELRRVPGARAAAIPPARKSQEGAPACDRQVGAGPPDSHSPSECVRRGIRCEAPPGPPTLSPSPAGRIVRGSWSLADGPHPRHNPRHAGCQRDGRTEDGRGSGPPSPAKAATDPYSSPLPHS